MQSEVFEVMLRRSALVRHLPEYRHGARDPQRPMKASASQMFARSNVARRVLSRRDEVEMTIENLWADLDEAPEYF
jgi:hypothetical protein